MKVAHVKDLADVKAKFAYRYLFWASARGYVYVVYHIISKFGISPFLAEKQD